MGIEEAYGTLLIQIERLESALHGQMSYVNAANRIREEVKQAALQKGWAYDMDCTALEYLKGDL